jgi:hypothetical protein
MSELEKMNNTKLIARRDEIDEHLLFEKDADKCDSLKAEHSQLSEKMAS